MQTTQLIQPTPFNPYNVEAIKISITIRDLRHRLLYKIPNVEIPNERFYQQYKLKRFCHYTIISSEGKEIKVNDSILDIYGGQYFQTLLSSNMKETSEQCIQMDAPFEVIESAIESLYLGPQSLEKAYKSGKTIDIYGILKFAHAHGMLPLFKQMVNLLILDADLSNVNLSETKFIKHLAKIYEDDQLERLARLMKSRCKVKNKPSDA